MSAKVMVRDATGATWQVKGGPEARAEAFSTRVVGALGYFAETVCFLAKGRIDSIQVKLRRADGFIQPDGSFTWAGFELRDPGLRFLPDQYWTWKKNPFLGSEQLAGLKILIMLLSNWDNKDGRNRWQGPNTGVLATTSDPPRQIYFVTDWGQTMGSWSRILLGSPWNCKAYTEQTRGFVRGVSRDRIRFGFRGQHTAGFADDITVAQARWFLQYLGRITDAQLHSGLLASGATPEEEACFASALRDRIGQLQRISGIDPTPALR